MYKRRNVFYIFRGLIGQSYSNPFQVFDFLIDWIVFEWEGNVNDVLYLPLSPI